MFIQTKKIVTKYTRTSKLKKSCSYSRIKTVAVFIGKRNTGPWQDAELDAFLREFVKRKCPVIPVLLLDCGQQPALPVFLQSMTWVDFRQPDPDPMRQLIWGITGLRAQ